MGTPTHPGLPGTFLVLTLSDPHPQNPLSPDVPLLHTPYTENTIIFLTNDFSRNSA